MNTTTLTKWATENTVSEEMIWKKAAQNQINKFQALADSMDAPIHVVSTHTSKSITLPVVQITGTNGRFVIRDNFYDYNLAVEWNSPVNIPMEHIYPVMTWEEYIENMKRKEEYDHWCDWTEEELNDPRITRIQITYDNGNKAWRDYSIEEKERWIKRFESTEWYTKDWSSGELIPDGELKEGCRFFIARHPYAQGIPYEMEKWGCYRPGKKKFLIALNEVDDVVRTINKG